MSAAFAAATAALLATLIWFFVPHLLRRRGERRLLARCRAAGLLILSYDDGPSETLTPALLDLLASERVHASFFMLGRNAAALPTLVRRALDEGHEVGSHTEQHANAWRTGPLAWARDVRRGIERANALGADGRLFRPPYGKLTLAGLLQTRRQNLRLAWWTSDSRDAWARRPIKDVLDEVTAKGGGVVLMHDFDSYAAPPGEIPHSEHCLELTRRLITLARSRGYRFARFQDLEAAN